MKTNEELEAQVLKTLKYKSLFGHALTKHQLIYFCQQKVSSLKEFEDTLEGLDQVGKIELKGGKYYLKTSANYQELGDGKDFSNAQRTFEHLQKYINLFSKINFINFIGVTGSLSSYFYKLEDDIDLFIIVKNNRVWITRFLLVLFMKLLKVYVHQDKAKLKFCPNIYISSISLEWDVGKRNIYSAHEILMMQPIYSSKDTYLEFVSSNSWIKDFFPNFEFHYHKNVCHYRENKILNLLDSLLMKLQLIYMKKPIHLVELSKSKIHFLVHDHSESILNQVGKF